tara:strand:- start:29 stop:853 length:825 start_codon:yes stop_codon:yes gene_type:complete
MAFITTAAGGAAISIGSSIFGAVSANKAQKAAEAKAEKSREEMNRQKDIYASLDISNPFLNMENTMEDLTVNQKASEFKKQQFQQSQSNILDGLRGSAGGSGVAALAQQLSQSGQLASQQSSVDIGRQEQSNQMLERQEASRIQGKEIEGEYQRRADEKDRTTTFLGMAQQETAAHTQAAGEAKAAKMSAIQSGITGAASMMAGFGDTAAQAGGGAGGPAISGTSVAVPSAAEQVMAGFNAAGGASAGAAAAGGSAPATQKFLNDGSINPNWQE